jgi:hypothetical protein
MRVCALVPVDCASLVKLDRMQVLAANGRDAGAAPVAGHGLGRDREPARASMDVCSTPSIKECGSVYGKR